jgi:hypothetical protein
MLKSSSLWLYSSNLGTFWLKIGQFWPFEEISIFSNGGHLGYRTALTDTILKGDHPRIISTKFGWDWLCSFRGEDFFLISSPFFLFLAWRPSWLEIGITGHNFGRGPSKDYSTKVWLQLAQWILRRRLLCEFPIGSYVKLSSAVGAILIEWPNRRTHLWKKTIHWLFDQNFVLIEQMVSDKKIYLGISHRVLC